MPAREAALAFATEHISESMKGLVLKIDKPDAQPPKSGEIGLRWKSGNGYAAPEEGATILRYDGYKSELLLSQVEIAGRASEEEIESAVMKTDSHPIPRLVAQQAYEILEKRVFGTPNGTTAQVSPVHHLDARCRGVYPVALP